MLVAASRNRSDSGSRPKASPPSWVTVPRPRVRIGPVRLTRSGRRLVPENLDMTPLLSRVGGAWCGRDGQGTGRTGGAESNGGRRFPARPSPEGSPSFTADRKKARPGNQATEDTGALPLSYTRRCPAAGLEP